MYIKNVNPIQPRLIGLEPRISKIKGENYDLLQGYFKVSKTNKDNA